LSRHHALPPKVSWECTGSSETGYQWALLIEHEEEYIYIDTEDISHVLDQIADLGEPQEACG
jgi:hypothetical protein